MKDKSKDLSKDLPEDLSKDKSEDSPMASLNTILKEQKSLKRQSKEKTEFLDNPRMHDIARQLAAHGNTISDCARILNIDAMAFRHRYLEDFEQGQTELRTKIRAKQIELAIEEGNVQMLIHLSKHKLDEKEDIKVTQNNLYLQEMDTQDLVQIAIDRMIEGSTSDDENN